MKSTSWNHAKLIKTNFKGANLLYASFDGADLTGADFRGVDFTDPTTFECTLECKILTDAGAIIDVFTKCAR